VTRLWDVTSGTELTAQVGLPYLSPTGDHLAVQGFGVDEVTFVDAATGRVLVRQPGVLSVDASAIDRSDAPQPTPLAGRPFSADGRYALGEQAGRAVLWDLSAGGAPTVPLLGPAALSSASPRVSPRGDLAVAIEDGSYLAFYDPSTGEAAGSFPVTSATVTSLSFNADGSRLALQDSAGLLQVFDLDGDGYWGKVGPVGDLEFSRDGRHVVVTWQAGVDPSGSTLFVTDLYDVASGSLVARVEGEYLATSRGTRPQLFVRRWDRTLAVSDLTSGRSVLTDAPGTQISAIVVAADSSRLAVATSDGVRVWNLSTDSPAVRATDLAPVALGLSFTPDNSRLVGVGIGSTPTAWSLQRVGNGDIIGATSATSSTILEDGVTVLEPTDASRTAVRYRNLLTGAVRPGPPLQPGDVVDFPLVGAEGTPHVVNLVGGGAVVARPDATVIGRTPGQVRTTSRDGSTLAVAEPGRSVSIVRTADLSVVATIDLEALPDDDLPTQADSIALGPDGSLLAATNGTGSTVVWDVASGRVLTRLDGRPTDQLSFPLWGLGFSPDGSRLVVKSPANDVRMYRVGGTGEWETLATERLPAQYAGRVVFSPDGELVVVDGLFVLDGRTLAPITTLLDGPGAVTRFTSDGDSLVTISVPQGTPQNAQRSVVRWSLSTDELTATACRIAGRNLTRDEWNRYLGSTGAPYRDTCS
jgi:WD40 repeat protein